MIRYFRRRRVRKLAKSASKLLIKKYGKKKCYTDWEITRVICKLGLSTKEESWVYGMFAEKQTCESFLKRIQSSETADTLRVFLAGRMFGVGSNLSYEGSWNRFHDTEDSVIGGISSLGNSGGSAGGDGGDFGGGFDGGGGE